VLIWPSKQGQQLKKYHGIRFKKTVQTVAKETGKGYREVQRQVIKMKKAYPAFEKKVKERLKTIEKTAAEFGITRGRVNKVIEGIVRKTKRVPSAKEVQDTLIKLQSATELQTNIRELGINPASLKRNTLQSNYLRSIYNANVQQFQNKLAPPEELPTPKKKKKDDDRDPRRRRRRRRRPPPSPPLPSVPQTFPGQVPMGQPGTVPMVYFPYLPYPFPSSRFPFPQQKQTISKQDKKDIIDEYLDSLKKLKKQWFDLKKK